MCVIKFLFEIESRKRETDMGGGGGGFTQWMKKKSAAVINTTLAATRVKHGESDGK